MLHFVFLVENLEELIQLSQLWAIPIGNMLQTRLRDLPDMLIAKSTWEKTRTEESCVAVWKERELRCSTGSEMSTLVNSEQLSHNPVYVNGIVDTITFLVLN